jgi:hypothetical protein
MALTQHSYKVAADVVKTEGPNRFSRDEAILVANSGALLCGTILGTVAVGAATSAAKAGGNTGNGTLTLDVTTPVLAGAVPGVYSVRMLTATTFRVEKPNGDVIGEGANGVAFSDDLKFVVAAGGTPFVAGDGFDITVATGSKKVKPLNAAEVADGSGVPTCVLLETVEARTADSMVVILARHAEVVRQALVYPGGIDAARKAAIETALEAKHIVIRNGV